MPIDFPTDDKGDVYRIQHLPHDLSEATFRVYEPMIAEGVRKFPDETQFRIPPGKAPSTFVARFRSSIVSLHKFDWPSVVDKEKLFGNKLTGTSGIHGQFSISRDFNDGTVWFRVKHRQGRPVSLSKVERVSAGNAGLFSNLWTDYDSDDVKAICKLISSRKVVGPFQLKGQVSELLVMELEGSNDVAVVYDDVKDITIIT